MIKTIRVKVPATTANLGPGFDVLGAALTLYNELEVTLDGRAADGRRCPVIEIDGEGKDSLPRDRRNIVWRSMREVFRRAEKKTVPRVQRLRLVNRIPLASGLGSSAAARLCGILAANAMCGGILSPGEVLALGVRLEGHPDNIVPALVGGLCVSFAQDGTVRYLKLPVPRLKAAVCNPDFELATERARKVLPKRYPAATVIFNTSRLALLMAALQGGRYELLSTAMEDRFHQPSRARLIPGMNEVFAAAREAGAYGAALSGAGPSLIALCPAARVAPVGRRMRQRWENFSVASRAFLLEFDSRGAVVRTK